MRPTLILAAAVLSASCAPAPAKTVDATPATMAAAIAAAGPGDTIRAAPGAYPYLLLKSRSFSPPLTIELGAAKLPGMRLDGVDGVRINGGQFSNGGRHGVDIARSKNVTLSDGTYTGLEHSLVVDRSTDVALRRNRFIEYTTDGINVAQSQRVTVEDTYCKTESTGEAHPDCVQAWSRPGGITSDLKILRTKVYGKTQGTTLFNHVRNGVDDGGFDRVEVRGTYYRGSYSQAVAVVDCRDCTVSDNDVAATPGLRVKPGGPPLHALVTVARSTGKACGNAVPDAPRLESARRC